MEEKDIDLKELRKRITEPSSTTPYPKPSGRELRLDELAGRCIYLSTTDLYNNKLYNRMYGQATPLYQHLETALLLGDTVIMHCIDPLRTPGVCTMLEKYQYFVQKGQIVFLLGSNITNVIGNSYKEYVKRKINEYTPQSDYCKADLELLQNGLRDSVLLNKVKKILKMSPYRLRRGYRGLDKFIRLVQQDLVEDSLRYIDDTKLRSVNLKLGQILNLIDTRTLKPFYERREVEKFRYLMQDLLDGKHFSAQIFLGAFRRTFSQGLGDPKYISLYNKVETRINLLHLQINVGNHTFIEINSDRDRVSPYYFEHFYRHLRCLSQKVDIDKPLGPDVVKSLKEYQAWKNFADYHLSIMSVLFARRLADMERVFDTYIDIGGHSEICGGITNILDKQITGNR